MRKTFNIVAVLIAIGAVLDSVIGILPDLGLGENVEKYIKLAGLVVTAILTVVSNLKSGQEIKELKSHYLK